MSPTDYNSALGLGGVATVHVNISQDHFLELHPRPFALSISVGKIFTPPVAQGKDLETTHHNFSHTLYSICQESLMSLPSRFSIYREHDHFPPKVSAKSGPLPSLLLLQSLSRSAYCSRADSHSKRQIPLLLTRGEEMAPSAESMP